MCFENEPYIGKKLEDIGIDIGVVIPDLKVVPT